MVDCCWRSGANQDGGVGDDIIENRCVAEVDEGVEGELFGEEFAELLSVGGAVVFIGGDVGEDAAGFEEVGGLLVEIDEEVGGADVALVAFGLEEGFERLDEFLADIRRVRNDDVEAAVFEDVLEEEVPEEEGAFGLAGDLFEALLGGGELVDFGGFFGAFFGGGAGVPAAWFGKVAGGDFVVLIEEGGGFVLLEGEAGAEVGDDFGVDVSAQLGLALGFARHEVGAAGFEDAVLVFGGGDAELGLSVVFEGKFGFCSDDLGDAVFAFVVAGVKVGEVDALEAFEQGVPLHDLVVEVRQGLGFDFVDDEGEPEAEAGDVDGAGVEVDAVDGFLDDVLFEFGAAGGVVEFGVEEGAQTDDAIEHSYREGAGADGGVADSHALEEAGNLVGLGGAPVVFGVEVAGVGVLDEAGECVVLAEVGLEVVEQGLAAHVGDDGLGGVVGALVLVVFEEVLEDVAEHLGVDADLVVFGVVFVDGEVVLREKLEQVAEVAGGEVDGLEGFGIGVEEAAVEVGHAGAGEGEDVAVAVGVEGVEEEGGEVFGVEAVGLAGVVGLAVEGAEELEVAACPVGVVSGAAEPFLALEELEEDEAAEEFFDEVADGFVGLVLGGGIVLVGDGEGAAGGGGVFRAEQVGDEFLVVFLVGFEEFFGEALDGEGVLELGEGEVGALLGDGFEATGGGAAGFVLAEEEGEAARGGFVGIECAGLFVDGGALGGVGEAPVVGAVLVEGGEDGVGLHLVDELGDVVAQADAVAGEVELVGGGDFEEGDAAAAGEGGVAELEGGFDFFVFRVEVLRFAE